MRSCKAWLKITLSKNIFDFEACASTKTHRRENLKLIVTNWKDRFELWITTTCIRISEAVIRRCSMKKLFLKILQNWQKSTCARVSFLIKLQASGNFIKKEVKEVNAKVFSYEFCEYLRTLFYRIPPVLAFLLCFHILLFPRSLLLTLGMYLFLGKLLEERLLFFESFKYLTQHANTQSQQKKR